jgi:ATP-binding cassette subfamily B protein
MNKVLKCLGQKRYLLLLIGGVIIAQVYLNLLLPDYMGKIQTIIQNKSSGDASREIDVLIQGGWMILISFGVISLAMTQNYLGAILSAYTGRELRRQVFSKVNSFELADFDKFGTSTLITRTTNDIEQIKNYVLFSIRILFMSPATMIFAILETVKRQAKLAIVLAFAVPIIIVLMVLMIVFVSPLFTQIQKKMDEITMVLRENLTGIRVVRAFNQQDKENAKFDVANKKMTDIVIKVGRFMSIGNPVISVVFNICYIGIYAFGFYIITLNHYTNSAESAALIGNTITDIVVVSQYSLQIMMSFLMFMMVFIMIPQAMASAKRVQEVIDVKVSKRVENPLFFEKDLQKSPEKGVIEFDNVSFKYPDSSEYSIRNISFKTVPGKTTAIIGTTGSGKSTIVNLIPKFYEASEGIIKLDGYDIKNIDQKALRNHLGFVPQTALLFKGTIKENMTFGKEDATNEEIEEALNVAQAEHFVSKLPLGIASPVAQGGKNFSGGQKQRLAIARALIRKPEIYVFDDSFSALDFKTDAKLRYALKNYTKDASLIVIAQRVSTILDADNIVVLEDGKCVGQGKHAELLKTCKTYREIVESQLDKEEIEKTLTMYQNIAKEGE